MFSSIFNDDADYARIADLTKGYWNPKKKIAGNHAFFRDIEANIIRKPCESNIIIWYVSSN